MAEYNVVVNKILNVLSDISEKLTSETLVLKPPHSTNNEGKINRFIKILDKHGWKGVELVVGSRGTLLTGTHRYNAAKRMGWSDIDIPTVTIKWLCELHGVDIKGLDNKGPILRGTLIFDELRKKLPKSVIKKYGL